MIKKFILILLISFFNKIYSQDYDVIYHMDYSFYLHNIDRNNPKIKIGFINNKGKVIQKAIYSDGVNNINGLANVTKDSVSGYLDKKNKLKLFPKFKKAFWNGDLGYAINKNNNYALINMNGDNITDFKYKTLNQTSKEFIYVSENGKKKFINIKGENIFNDTIKNTNNGIYNSTAVYTNNDKFGLININGKIITKLIYDVIFGDKDSKNWIVEKNNKFGVISSNGREIIPLIYDEINYLVSEKDPIPLKMKGKFGYIYDSKEIIPFIYDEALPFKNGIARVKKDNKYHYINIQNKVICSFDHQGGWNGKDYFSNGLSLFKFDGKYGYINKKGDVVIEPIYQSANNFKEGIALIEKDGLFGFINAKGKIVIPIKYEILSDVYNGRIMFGVN